MGTGALGRIEGKRIGSRFRKRDSAVGTHQMPAEIPQLFFRIFPDGAFSRLVIQNRQRSLSLIQSGNDGIRNSFLVPFFRNQLIYYQLYKMRFITVQGLNGSHFIQPAIYPHLPVAFFKQTLEQFFVMSFPACNQRSQHDTFLSLVLAQYQLYDLVIGIFYHFAARYRRIGIRCPRIKKPEKIINFRNGSHRRTGILPGGFLLDGDNRAQARDAFHGRTFQNPYELSGVGRQRFHIPALPLGINRIESQRRLAAPAQTRNHHQFIAGYGYIHPFQVMFPRPPYFYLIHFPSSKLFSPYSDAPESFSVRFERSRHYFSRHPSTGTNTL